MTRVITISIIVSFVAIAVFGFFGIEFMTSHHASCIVSTSQGGVCPEGAAPLDYVNFHLNALRNFSTAVFASVSFLALSLILVLVFALNLFGERMFAPEVTTPRPFGCILTDFSPPLLARLSNWLSLHENSPTLS